ncbi:MAG TPA: XrtA/PEP-CTERM system TPR-repeat protein PrsT, partial [Alphaproteobacteria bacterium]
MMFQAQCGRLWRSLAVLAAIGMSAVPSADAKDSSDAVRDAETYLATGDLKAAMIELKNAVSLSPQDAAIRARLAKVYLQLEDFTSAEREARSARELSGDEADFLPILADALLAQKKFEDVLNVIEPGDRAPVLESQARTAIGIAAAGLHYGANAEAMLRDAIRLDPSAMKPRLQLAQLLNKTNPESADQVIDAAIAASPQSAEPLQLKGEMLWSRGDLDGAVRLFGEALLADPKNLRAHLSRANVDIVQGKFAAADEDLDPILKAAPQNFLANYLRGFEQLKQQQYGAADRTFDRFSPAFSSFPDGYYLQGLTKLALGQFEPAEGILAKYLRSVPNDPQARRLIASAALQQNGATRAIKYLTPLVDGLPPDPATLTLLGNAYMADGKPELALQQFEKAAALDPESPGLKTRTAVAEITTGRARQGLEELERVFASATGAVIAGPSLVLTDLHAGRIDKAAEVATSLINRDADNPLYQTLLGEVRVAQRDYTGAETEFRAALGRNPQFAAATRDLAELYVATGRIDDAKKVYTDLLAKDAGDGTALLGLADIAIAEKKWAEAIDDLNRARAVAKHDPAPGLKLVRVYESRTDWDSAKAIAMELGELFPLDADVAEAQGRARLEAGDTKGAIASYKLAQQLAPDSVPILSRYVALLRRAKYFRDARDVLQDAVARNPRNASIKA